MTDLSFIDERVEESLNYLRRHFDAVESYSDMPLYHLVLEGLRATALGGKHLRSRLVHVGAGEVSGEQRQAAVVFGAAVDLLHSSLLVHDDIIDRDPFRRGVRTIHSSVEDRTGSEHLGHSVGILAGDMGLMGTFQALSASQLPPELVQQACAIMAGYANQTIFGELLDVSHLIQEDANADTVRVSNHMKTSIYSFMAPLHLGALAAGENTSERVRALSQVSDPLGCAYQAVDDIAGAIAPMEVTGKVEGGDIAAGRTTLLTMRLGDMSIEEAVEEVRQEAVGYIADARAALADNELPAVTRAGIEYIIQKIERSLHELVA